MSDTFSLFSPQLLFVSFHKYKGFLYCVEVDLRAVPLPASRDSGSYTPFTMQVFQIGQQVTPAGHIWSPGLAFDT